MEFVVRFLFAFICLMVWSDECSSNNPSPDTLSRSVSHCLTLSHIVSINTFISSHIVPNCLILSHCPTLSQIVSYCFTLSHIVSQCLTLSHIVPHCLHVIGCDKKPYISMLFFPFVHCSSRNFYFWNILFLFPFAYIGVAVCLFCSDHTLWNKPK